MKDKPIYPDLMTNEEARLVLIAYNKWRSGEDEDFIETPQFSPKLIGQAIDVAIRALGDKPIQYEWHKCPKCDGQGIVSKPPWIAGDVYEWSSTTLTHQCNVCNGQMIIQSPLNPKP